MCLNFRFFLPVLMALVFPAMIQSQVIGTLDLSRQAREDVGLIHVRWSAADEKAWHVANDGRLDLLGINVNLSANALSMVIKDLSGFGFDVGQSGTIEMMVKVKQIAPGETILLRHISTGEVIFDFSAPNTSSFLTPAFDPSAALLEWQCPQDASCRSEFEIPIIYFQPSAASGMPDIGFGTSLPCHPNAACKEDSMKQLISGSAVRIRMVMDEGIGWCSGGFINNTRNDKTPYLLTAYHCQFNYTPQYDLWRFDINYSSSTCPNPTEEPAFFSMVGCELISLGQASDFLLVRLEDAVPINQNVTFAGWSRDDVSTADTSYCVHHPNADILKFSTTVNKSVIHPNQIGWSEGYTTPANHHFRFKFTEGGHEAGSSGAPVFNEDFYLVGQLHGGSAGCENDNNTFIGRFSKSWNAGATPGQRLSDWLDPDQTNLVSIPSFRNIGAEELVDIHGVIKDPMGKPLKNAVIKVTGAKEENLVTGDDGRFTLSQVSRTGQYILTPEKNDHPTNGLNTLDLIAIQKHLLGKDTFNLPWKFIAADATNNVDISVGDIVLLLRLMLGKIQALPSSPSWRFDPPQFVVDPVQQGEPPEAQFTGIKIGDLNGTANPGI